MRSRDYKDCRKNPLLDLNTDEGAYILGYFVADGGICLRNTRKDGTRVYETYITSKDKEHLVAIARCFGCGEERLKPIRNGKLDRDYWRFSTFDTDISSVIVGLGLYPKRKAEFKIPEDINLSSFIRGLLDADGTIIYNNSYLANGLVKVAACAQILLFEPLVYKISSILSSWGIDNTVYSEAITKSGYKIRRLRVKQSSNGTFLDRVWGNSQLFLIRKKERLLSSGTCYTREEWESMGFTWEDREAMLKKHADYRREKRRKEGYLSGRGKHVKYREVIDE